jgi:hypothetical protein
VRLLPGRATIDSVHPRSLLLVRAPAGLAGLSLLVTACGSQASHNQNAAGGDQLKLAFALQVARCMRSHRFSTYPDPATPSPSSQGSGTRFDGTGIDTKSPQFQTAETNCEKQVRKALGLP